MKTYTTYINEDDRTRIAEEIANTLNGLWNTITDIYLREKDLNNAFLNQLCRHFVFLEKSLQYMAVDCKLEIFMEYHLDDKSSPLFKLPKKFVVVPTEKTDNIRIETITNKILKETHRSFNELANKNSINFTLIENIYRKYRSREFKGEYEYLDIIKGSYVKLRMIYKNENKCLMASDNGEYYNFTIKDYEKDVAPNRL